MSKGKYLPGGQAVTIFVLSLIFFSLFSRAQAEPLSRDEEIEKIFERMDADINFIADASGRSILEEGAVKPAIEQKIPTKQIQKETSIHASPASALRSSREQNIEITLRDIAIEISLEYFMNMGSQTVNFIYPDTGADMSRLEFPLEGNMPIIKGEVRFMPRVSLGGKYANSQLKERVCSDEDWDFDDWRTIDKVTLWKHIDYQITKQGSKSRVEFYDINLYYNLFTSGEDNPDQRAIFPAGDPIYQNLNIDRVSLDVLAGYQYYKGRYRMVDPVYELEDFIEGGWYYGETLPDDFGLDNFYKIEYWGPRIGLRLGGSKGKVSSQIKFAYALLQTKTYGWWNLRDYSFWGSGKNGYGIEFGFDTTFAFTPSFSAGLGFNYFGYFQKKMKESGNEAGDTFYDLDIVRDANSRNFGPSFILKYIW